MNPAQWQWLSAAFDELCELAAETRERRLAELARESPELAGELARMLAADGADGGVLAGGAVALAPEADGDAGVEAAAPDHAAETSGVGGPLAPGARLGPWRLVELLGAGGMGEVWSAERADGAFEQRVAVKLLRRGLETDSLLRRFLLERQILARLVHPGIARLLDAGSTADGRPFFVMERVAGSPITSFADQRELPVEARLRLVLEVAAAVDFAHRNLIVHRDLKPSNVLVDDAGTVKLLDFGIAKLLEPEHGTALTELDQRALTPAYAAPEQIRGEPVTTATDVYALGVLLYELLTGRLPHRRCRKRLAELTAELERETIERPSTTVRREATGAGGAPEVERLARRLAGDLDTIVLKALAREPERRYPSAAALADDLRRHLSGLPVAARPDTLAYRSGKFVRRHAGAITGAVAIAALLALLTTVHTLRLARERDRARLEGEKAQRIAAFLTSLFELSDLDRTRGVKLSVREIVDRGAASLERDLAGEPEVAATMMGLIGTLYVQLDLKEEARPLLEKALAIRRRLFGDDAPEVVASQRALGELLHELGQHQAAADLLLDALAVAARSAGPASAEVARTRTVLASVHKSLGDYGAATAELERAISTLERAGPAAQTDLAQALNSQGQMFLRLDRAAEALPLFRRALAIRERLLGPESPSTAATLLNLGAALRETGDVSTAIAHDERFLALVEKALGVEHSLYAYGLAELALARSAKGDAAIARDLYQRAIAAFETAYGPEDSSALLYRRRLALLLAASGDQQGALEHFAAVLALREKALPADHPQLAESLFDVGRMRARLGDHEQAERLMRRGLGIQRRRLPADSLDLTAGLGELGELLCAGGQPEEGRLLLEEVLASRRRNPSPAAPDVETLAAAARRCGAGPVARRRR